MSGATPSWSKACRVPGLPSPILTSSQIIGTPCGGTARAGARGSRRAARSSRRRTGSARRSGRRWCRRLRCCSASSRQAVTSASMPPGPGRKGLGYGRKTASGSGWRTGVDVHAGNAHRHADTAVVAVLERDDGAPPGGVPAGPQRDVVGVGARVPQVHPPFAGAGDQREQVLGEAHRIGVDRGQATGARRRPHRPADRLDDRRVAVAEAATPSRSPTGRAARARRA